MNYQIHWLYKPKRGKDALLQTEFMPLDEALQLAADFEKTGRVKELSFYDEMGTHWTRKEAEKLGKKAEEEPQRIVLCFDGGFDLQLKRAGIGVCMYYEKNGNTYRVRRNSQFHDLDNNNEAEYAALLYGMQLLEEAGVQYQTVTLRGDSQVVLNQLSGEWPCYEEGLARFLDRIEEKAKRLKILFQYDLVSRKQNKEAHNLATQALQGIAIDSHAPVEQQEE
ncbi:reverse transcriptase-like protein [Ectobacillus ponti]|uniref:Reverse transcriptase-like protein n=1 Tax=Ectobacillus ponti TaxID=2961894 RepID=A0AA41X4J9_9BACI|nr:reverse transcriptase-like protein [Ectobacillus ponti]MCP8968819.1 reverse transcriptase-like protein [Ectobacillus ponti]